MPVFVERNVEFFKRWSEEMAYVLGFFAADGSMYISNRGSHYVSFYSNDKEIPEKIRATLNSKNKISKRKSNNPSWNDRFTLQIGSKVMYKDLLDIGFVSNKSRTLRFPDIPKPYLKDFVRGYFDGDGNVLFKNYYRKDRNKYKDYLATKFISGSIKFLTSLRSLLVANTKVGRGSLFEGDRSFVLSYAMNDSKKLFEFMYDSVENDLYLGRKYNIFLQAIDNTER